jgi:septum formation protein
MDSPFPRIVLASNSPRRKQLLALGGWDFRVAAVEVDESPLEGEKPEMYVARQAEAKAKAAVEARNDEVVVAADTTVVADGKFLGKPADADQAVKMLQQLRGRVHQVFTGLAVLRIADGALLVDFCSTDVTMRDYSDEEIAAYVSSGDPMDKAGAYAIQHRGFNPASPLQGCYANVVGLPLCNLLRTLKKVGVYARNDVPRACQVALQYECPVFEMILEA